MEPKRCLRKEENETSVITYYIIASWVSEEFLPDWRTSLSFKFQDTQKEDQETNNWNRA